MKETIKSIFELIGIALRFAIVMVGFGWFVIAALTGATIGLSGIKHDRPNRFSDQTWIERLANRFCRFVDFVSG